MEQIFLNELKANFNLRKASGSKPSLIYFVVSLNGKQYKLATGLKVYPSMWDKKHQQAIVSRKFSEIDNRNNLIVNAKIKELSDQFSKYKLYLCTHYEELVEALPLLRTFIYGDMAKNNITIDIIQFLTDEVTNKSGKSAVVYQKYINHLAAYLEYRKAHRQSEIKNFKELAKSEVFKDMQDYYCREFKGTLMVGYVNEMLAKLHKTLLYYAINESRQGYITKADIDNIHFRPLHDKASKANKVFLSNDEVTRLFQHHCDNTRDEEIKDLFLLECTTGYRRSDIKDLDKFTFEQNGILYFETIAKKTSSPTRMPVYFDMARQILNKYKASGLPKVSDTTYNKRIKDICKACGICQPCTQSHHYIGSDEPTIERVEKYKLVSSHTGRHTFGCLLALRGLNNDQIGKYTGQSSKTVDRYLASLTAVDYETYRQQRKETPEVIVKSIDEIKRGNVLDTPPDGFVGVSLNEAKAIRDCELVAEYKDVLMFLGAPYEEIRDLNDIDKLSALLYGKYERKLTDEGVKRDIIKSIYNAQDLDFRKKQERLLQTLDEIIASCPVE